MKVLHVIPSVAPVRGGPSKAIYEMANSLHSQQGIEVEIATTNDNGDDLLDIPLNRMVGYHGIPTRFFSRFSPSISSVREFAISTNLTTWLWKHVQDYDLIHIHAIFSYPSTVAMAIARIRKVPYIVRPLGQLCEWSLTQSLQKKKAYLRIIERANLDGCQTLHLTSQQEQKEVSQLHLKSPSFVLPHGLEFSALIPNARQKLRDKLGLPSDEPIILFLSRIHEKKGLDHLIPALSSIASERFTFVLAGSGDPTYESEVQQLLKSNNLQTRTISTGFVEGEFKRLLLQGSDIFALTSYSENFGVAVLEALSAGTPAIVTPGVALSSEVHEQKLGFVVDQNISDISNGIIQYFRLSEKIKNELSIRSSQFVRENYSWKAISERLYKHYKIAISKQITV